MLSDGAKPFCDDVQQSTMDAPPPPLVLVLHIDASASPPPPPQLDYLALAEKTRAADDAASGGVSPLLIQLIATVSVCALIGLCFLLTRCYRRRALRLFLAGLPEASEDGTWLVVLYEWGGVEGTQSGRMPLDGIVRMRTLFYFYFARIPPTHARCRLLLADNNARAARGGGRLRQRDH